MPVPPEPVLRAAHRWLERLPVSGLARCRALFTTHGDFSDLTPTQYDAAYSWLGEAGLLHAHAEADTPSERLFDAAVLGGDTPWFRDADRLVRSPDELPEDARRAAQTLGLSDSEAWARICALWSKVDVTERARVGDAGERALINLLKASTVARIEHVSTVTDTRGFDIAVRSEAGDLHLEVKATTRRGRLAVYLSRHEYLTMLHDPSWHLVVIRLDDGLQAAAVASVPRSWIDEHIPINRGDFGRWESCRLDIPAHVPRSGIPALSPFFSARPSPHLTGEGVWPG